jgi:hypothetical protein
LADQQGTVLLEGARLIFRNFSGKEDKYNAEGSRVFGVIIPDPAIAEQMLADGWNVKYLKPSEEEQEEGIEQGPPWLQVKVGFGGRGRPPQIFLINDRGKRTHITEETVEELDWVDITNADLIIRPYHYDVQGRGGISAYLQSLYLTIEEDPLARKYSEMESQ